MESKAQSAVIAMWREVCRGGGSLSFNILSNSMRPTLEVGDIVRVGRIEPAAVHIGDILAFQVGQDVVVHRVMSRSHAGGRYSFHHRGDAGGISGKITEQKLIGKVLSIKKEGRREIPLDTPRAVIINRIMGWRLRFIALLAHRRSSLVITAIHRSLKLPWKLYHRAFLRY